jgi:hypothetical protein
MDGLRLDVTVVVVSALFTVCETDADELPLYVLSPLYEAVIECVPTVRLDVEMVALPFASSVDEPRIVAPSENVTLPVGVPVPLDGLTVAKRTTDWPNVDGFGDETSDVAVAITMPFTVCVRTDDALPA